MTEYTGKAMRKRLFIGLLGISLVLLLGAYFVTWWLFAKKGQLFNRAIVSIIITGAGILFVLLTIGLAALVWSLWFSRHITLLQNIMHNVTYFLFPFAVSLGRSLGWSEERIKNSFIQVSNHLVKTRKYNKPINNILILAPHCLQWVHCPHKITIEVENCRECGKCPVTGLIRLARQYNINLKVVTGGTLARKAVKECRPEAIVAIACERDLTSGIQDIPMIPVIGVVNERPEGPCCNTCVDLGKVEEAIQFFLEGGSK